MSNNILVSIIMPTYNTKELYLRQAIESILNQTYSNFEFIIIDDGSIEEDELIIKSYKDRRIKFYRNERNFGLTYTLNRALSLAKGKYILRMDSDDIACSDRVETSIKYMENNNEVVMAGGNVRYFGQSQKVYKVPLTNESIRAQLLITCPFVHPTVIFNGELIKKYGFMYREFSSAEDYLSWFELSKINEVKFGNINKILINYRIHSSQITKVKTKQIRDIVHFKLLEELQVKLSDVDKDAYRIFVTGEINKINNDIAKSINNIIKRILLENEVDKICNKKFFIKYYKFYCKKLCFKKLIKLNLNSISVYNYLISDV